MNVAESGSRPMKESVGMERGRVPLDIRCVDVAVTVSPVGVKIAAVDTLHLRLSTCCTQHNLTSMLLLMNLSGGVGEWSGKERYS
jgi:hypothetical protein